MYAFFLNLTQLIVMFLTFNVYFELKYKIPLQSETRRYEAWNFVK